ncbi:hypothetical protein CEXT_312731 [Caerostris extrusa]|uniref:Uncharacterized protein n=1 Tax=Caerostris extrusa TaxID=172846 RepID=A0AAV4U8E1_CAEEX|nr:hypothetical protein CEXT_312731 [Caerostris extrusa]
MDVLKAACLVSVPQTDGSHLPAVTRWHPEVSTGKMALIAASVRLTNYFRTRRFNFALANVFPGLKNETLNTLTKRLSALSRE